MDTTMVDRIAPDRIRIRRARITDIEFERRRAYITVVYRDREENQRGRQRVVLVTSPDTRILDDDRNIIRARELRKGMIINAVVSAQFQTSNPPRTYAYRIVVKKDVEEVLTSEGYVLFVEPRRGELVILEFKEDESYDLSIFIVTDKTKIYNSRNQPIQLEDLRRGMQVTIDHSMFETKVFPPTSVAYKIYQS